MPALPPYIIEPIWQQFSALLPERKVDHPLGCHCSRIPDRVVFEKLVQVLVFGCAYPEGQALTAWGNEALGGREDELLAQCPQKARVVHGEAGAGHRLLGGFLGGGHHRQAADPRGLDPLPLGRSSFPTAMTYLHKL